MPIAWHTTRAQITRRLRAAGPAAALLAALTALGACGARPGVGDDDDDDAPDDVASFDVTARPDLDEADTTPVTPPPCGLEPEPDLLYGRFEEASVAMVLPARFTATRHPEARAVTFVQDDGLALIYAIQLDAHDGPLGELRGEHLRAMSQNGDRSRHVWLDEAARAWYLEPQQEPNAVHGMLRYSYGPGTDNPEREARDLGALLRAHLEAMGDVAIDDAAWPARSCASLVHYHLLERRLDAEIVAVGLLSCEDDFNADAALQLLAQDLIDTTLTAPLRQAPPELGAQTARCQGVADAWPPLEVDVVWVIDDSPSMRDELAAVAQVAGDLVDHLDSLPHVDWRVAVTTHRAHCLDGVACAPRRVDPCTGLLGDWISGDDPQRRARLIERLTLDTSCPSGQNQALCGAEGSGLDSGLTLLGRLAPTSGSCAPEASRLRPGASLHVVWSSDGEDAAFIGADGRALEGAEREARVGFFAERYRSLAARPLALVGDAGLAAGGACAPVGDPRGDALGAAWGRAFEQVADAAQGRVSSVCEPARSWADSVVPRGVSPGHDYPLGARPIAATLRVTINGEPIPRVGIARWLYDPATNGVYFLPAAVEALASGDKLIEIAYRVWP